MSSKAAVGALVGGLAGATVAILGKAVLSRQQHPESFDAVTSAGLLIGAITGAAVGDSFGLAPTQTASNTPQLPQTTATS